VGCHRATEDPREDQTHGTEHQHQALAPNRHPTEPS
jgi:hypothetical protein